jgi:hypothetical protein
LSKFCAFQSAESADLLFPANYYYKGDMDANDRPHGQGTVFDPHGRELYCGEWVAGKREGMGYYRCLDGITFEGEWKGDQPDGFGVERDHNGAILRCGRWYVDGAQEPCPVPLANLPARLFLSHAGT